MTVGYRVTEISVAASARVPGAIITVTGRRPDGAPLKTGTSIDGVDLDLGGKRLRADSLKSFVDLSVGENEITVEVANGGTDTNRTYRASVVRLDADLENADERSQLFREALVNGSADGLSRHNRSRCRSRCDFRIRATAGEPDHRLRQREDSKRRWRFWSGRAPM